MARLLRGVPVVLWVLVAIVVALAGCETTPGSNDGNDFDPGQTIGGRFLRSLHGSRQGKANWYAAANGGLEGITGVPITDLPCQGCHSGGSTNGSQPDCMDCHTEQPGDPVPTDKCLGCHPRQVAERSMFPSDVHRAAGMGECVNCHTEQDMHGDGTPYPTMLSAGAIHIDCEDCHRAGVTTQQGDGALQAPQVGEDHGGPHHGRLHCSACHVESVVTCYNCHVNSTTGSSAEAYYKDPDTNAPFSGWIFLMNRNGKVYSANFQSAVYTGDDGATDGFVAFGPMVGHTIMSPGRSCPDCHNNANMQQYWADGAINVATWNDATGRIDHATGVIAVPPDFQDTMRFDFANLQDDGTWTKADVRSTTMQVYEEAGSPLTQTQMILLRYSLGS